MVWQREGCKSERAEVKIPATRAAVDAATASLDTRGRDG